MRSPSPELNADSLSDSEELLSTSEPGPTVKSPCRATAAIRAVPSKKGQHDAGVRPLDHHGPHHNGTLPAAKLPNVQELVTALESGMDSRQTGPAQAEQSTALLPPVPIKETATKQDAAQQTFGSPERPAHSGKHDACVQSEGPIMPHNNKQLPIAVPTDERGTQTPIGHTSPRPLQRAPPGRDPEWSAHNAEQDCEARSPAPGHSLSYERTSQFQGYWPRRPSPPTQWASAAFDPLSYTDNVAAHRDGLSVSASPSPDQQLPEYIQQSAQSYGGRQQVDMQLLGHPPAEQQVAAPDSQARQQDSEVRRSAEAAASLHTGHQDSNHPPAGTSNDPAKALLSAASAGIASCLAQHTVVAPTGSGSNPVGFATAPSIATPTQAGAGSTWPTPLPDMADPSLPPRPQMHAHVGPHVLSAPQRQTPHLPGEAYAYRQSLPNVAQPAVLHAHARGMNMGLGSGQRAATVRAHVSVMQRQQASQGMHGLRRRTYTGESCINGSAQIWFSAS